MHVGLDTFTHVYFNFKFLTSCDTFNKSIRTVNIIVEIFIEHYSTGLTHSRDSAIAICTVIVRHGGAVRIEQCTRLYTKKLHYFGQASRYFFDEVH